MIRRPPRSTLSLHDALPISSELRARATAHGAELAAVAQRHALRTARPRLLLRWSERWRAAALADRKSTRLNSSHANISYAVFCLKKKQLDDLCGAVAHDRRT